MNSKEQLFSYAKEYSKHHKDEILDNIRTLARIPSVQGKSEQGMPFGRDPHTALITAADMYRRDGLYIEDHSDDGYMLCCEGEGEKTLGLFFHCDIVPAGDGWLFSDNPYEPVIRGDYLIGRGVADDKDGIVLGLHALRALREAGWKPKNRVQIYLGGNEETGMADMNAYLESHKDCLPDVSISPDANFPMERGERAGLVFEATAGDTFEHILDFSGGDVQSRTCGNVTLTLKHSSELEAELKAAVHGRNDAGVQVSSDRILLTVSGKAGHISSPKGTVNAAFSAAEILLSCPSLGEHDMSVLEQVKALTGDVFGVVLGTAVRYGDCYPLTAAVYGVSCEGGKVTLKFFCKHHPDKSPAEYLQAEFKKNLEKIGWIYRTIRVNRGFVIPEEHPLIQLLYSQCMAVSDKNARIYVGTGATYSHLLPNSVAVGIEAPMTVIPDDFPPMHGHRHEPDECVNIEYLLNGVEYIARFIVAMDDYL